MANAPSRKMYLVAVAVMLVPVGLALGIGLPRIARKVRGFPRVVMPGEQELALAAGEHTLFFETSSVVDGKSYQNDAPGGVSCGIVSADDGAAIELSASSSSTTYTMGSYQGRSIASFTAPRAGRYRLSCRGAGDRPFVIAFGQGMLGVILWTAIPAGAGFLAGLVFLIVVWRKRKRALRG